MYEHYEKPSGGDRMSGSLYGGNESHYSHEYGQDPYAKEHTTGQKVIAGVVGVGLAAGAIYGISLLPDGTVLPKDPTRSRMEERSAEMYAFRHDLILSNVAEDINKAAERIPHVTDGFPQLGPVMRKAVDQKRALKIVDNPFLDPDKRIPSASITDIPLRKIVDTTMYTFDLADIISDNAMSTTEPKLQAAKDLIAKTAAPADDEQIKAHAIAAVDQKYAQKALVSYRAAIDTPDSREKLNKAADQIADPATQKNLLYAADQRLAIETINDLVFDNTTVDQAHAASAQIADPMLQERVNTAIKNFDPQSMYSYHTKQIADDIDAESHYFENEHFSETSSEFGKDQQAAKDSVTILRNDSQKAGEVAEIAFNQVMAETIGVQTPPVGPTLQQPTDPYEKLDLKGLEATQEIDDPSGIIDPEKKDNVLRQFGEVRVANGQPVVTFQENGVPEKLQQQFRQAFQRTDPMLRAAFASGNVSVVRLTLADSFNGYYSDATREEVLQLDPDDTLTADQLDGLIMHESNHGIMRNYFRGLEVTPEEHKALATACFNLQTLAYNSIQDSLFLFPELLQNLRAAAKPEHRAIIDTLTQSINGKTLASDLQSDFTSYDTTAYNECNYSGNPWGIIRDSKSKTKSAENIDIDDLNYLAKTDAFTAFYGRVQTNIEYASVFDDAINESNYSKTSSYVKNSLGHGEDNANELYASLLNAAMRNEKELMDGLAKLPANERETVRQALRVAVQSAAKRAPSLKPAYDYIQNQFGL